VDDLGVSAADSISMRAFFLLHDDWYQYIKADVIASRYPFEGFVVIHRKRDWWGKYLWKRARRIGFAKVIDELLLRAYMVVIRGRRERRLLRELMVETQQKISPTYKRPPVHHIRNINSPEGQSKLRELAPDVCVLMVHPILSSKTFTIPRLGMLVFHPGVTPEYRGPHSAFWAVTNNEFWGIGWSLLKVDKGIDTGPVLAQGSSYTARPPEESYLIMQHRSHIDGIPHVVDVLRRLERGEQPVTPMVNRRSTNYTHPGLTDYLVLRRRLAQLRKGTAPSGSAKPAGVL
jgi:folate-dependent phosphoribosylglycinamide formyltransferase PurN